MCFSDSNVEILMSGSVRCYSLVIAVMDAFPEEEEIQEVACCLFEKFTSGETSDVSLTPPSLNTSAVQWII